MPKWVIVVALALGAVLGVVAQGTASFRSVALLSGNFSALAVTLDGERLIAADAEDNRAHVFSLDDPSDPQLLNSVDLDGVPVAVAGAEDFGLIAVDADNTGLLQIIAIPSYDPRQGYINYGTYDVTANPEGIALSPSGRWSIVYGQNGYTLLEILSVDEIDSITIGERAVSGAALTDNVLLLLPSDRPVIEVIGLTTLSEGLQRQEVTEIALDTPADAIAVTDNGDLAAVLLENGTLVLLNPTTGEVLSSTRLDEQFSTAQYLDHEGDNWLVLAQPGSDSLRVYDASNPGDITAVQTPLVRAFLQAVHVFDNLLITSNSRTTTIYSAQ